MLVVLPAIECKLQDVHKSLLNSREIQTDYYFNCASLFVFTIIIGISIINYIGCCNIALLKLLTVLFIVGCNNRKLYYRIAPNFRGTQFSRIAVFQNFVETIFADQGSGIPLYSINIIQYSNISRCLIFEVRCHRIRLCHIMPKILPIMLFSNAA